jgi:hypothetical protein
MKKVMNAFSFELILVIQAQRHSLHFAGFRSVVGFADGPGIKRESVMTAADLCHTGQGALGLLLVSWS